MLKKRSTTILGVMFIVNPFVLLFTQNCSKAPSPQNSSHESQITSQENHTMTAVNRKPASTPVK